jgi:hypothetical protein
MHAEILAERQRRVEENEQWKHAQMLPEFRIGSVTKIAEFDMDESSAVITEPPASVQREINAAIHAAEAKSIVETGICIS